MQLFTHLPIQEAAWALGVHRVTVQRALKRSQFPSYAVIENPTDKRGRLVHLPTLAEHLRIVDDRTGLLRALNKRGHYAMQPTLDTAAVQRNWKLGQWQWRQFKHANELTHAQEET